MSRPEKPEIQSLFEAVEKNLESVKHVIAVISGKGGVGKSFISSAIAISLWLKGRKVAILDADVHGPSIPWIFGLNDRYVGATIDGRLVPPDIGGLAIMSIELLLENRRSPVIWRGPMKTRALIDLASRTLWGERDYLIVDLPPGTGDEPLTIAQSMKSKLRGVVLVMTPGEMVSHIVSKAREFARILGIELLGAVLNMSYLRCPMCGAVIKPFGEPVIEDVEVLCEIPIDPELAKAINSGKLVEFIAKSESETAKILRSLGDIIERKVEKLGKG